MTTTPAQGSRKIYLPVKADTNGIIRDSIGQIVCDTIPEYARQIVVALNSHQQLREALERIVDGKQDDPKDTNGMSAGEISNGDLRAARAALKASEVKE